MEILGVNDSIATSTSDALHGASLHEFLDRAVAFWNHGAEYDGTKADTPVTTPPTTHTRSPAP